MKNVRERKKAAKAVAESEEKRVGLMVRKKLFPAVCLPQALASCKSKVRFPNSAQILR
jgi:hypothetical protein